MSLASRGAEFFRFCIVGGLTFLVDYGLLFLLTSVLDVHYLWSSAWAHAGPLSWPSSSITTFACSSSSIRRLKTLAFTLFKPSALAALATP